MYAAYIITALFFAHHSPATDCGASRYSGVIKKTTSLILEKAPIGSLVREFPTSKGTPECARVRFSIDSDGRAINISMPESSGNFDVDMAVVRSVKKYHFRTETFGAFRTYMLVFKVDYNKMPSNYLNKKNNKNQKGDVTISGKTGSSSLNHEQEEKEPGPVFFCKL